jgi:hypothetical protein
MADLIGRKKKAKAFCSCEKSSFAYSRGFRVKHLGHANEVFVSPGKSKCPYCGHSLYWSINYYIIGTDSALQNRARRAAEEHEKSVELAKMEDKKK